MKRSNVFALAAFRRFIFSLLSCVILAIAKRAEADQCGYVSSALTPPYIPTTDTFRVLIVFVQFQDDTFDAPCQQHPTNGWPSSLHAIPNWATGTSFIHSQAAAQYTAGSLSHFYDLMSNGTFDFIGDVYPQVYITPQPKSYYDINQGRGRGWLNQQIIDWMNPNVNFANYDNDNDGDVDMIIFICRNWNGTLFNNDGYQGIADLGFTGSITRDGKSILGGFPGSGISQHNVYTLGDCWNIVTHEISHYQFGGNHFDYIGKFGVHDGNNGATTMSGYERSLLGWSNPTLITSDTSVTLTDAATTSNYYRINIPNSDEYFLLENRKALSIYEQNDFCSHTGVPATGLMIAHIRPSETKINQIRWEAADNTFLIDENGQASDSYKPGNKVQFTPWTRPNSDRSNGNNTGIAVTNINQNGNNITADIILNFCSGTLTEDSWWEVSESICGNVTLIIRRNGDRGVYAAYYCTVFLGQNTSPPSGGRNSIYENYNPTGFQISILNGSTSTAEQNWWGTDPPNTSIFEGISSIDYNPWWTGSDPHAGRPLSKVLASNDTVKSPETDNETLGVTTDLREKLWRSFNFLQKAEYDSAIQISKEIVATTPSSHEALSAINILRLAYSENEKPGFEGYITSLIAQHARDEVAGVARLNWAWHLA